jgi:hypothetical protein
VYAGPWVYREKLRSSAASVNPVGVASAACSLLYGRRAREGRLATVLGRVGIGDPGRRAYVSSDAPAKFVQNFAVAWAKMMNLDRYDLA